MFKSLEELKRIVAGTPEGALYYCSEADEYVCVFCRGCGDGVEFFHAAFTNEVWIEIKIEGLHLQSLEDLRRIIKLEEENQRLRDLLVKVMDDYQLAASAAEREGYKTSYSELSKIVDSEFEENREGKEL